MTEQILSSLEVHLAGNRYPGRGILLGQSPDGQYSAAAYFIMGRSRNSRNRIFREEPDGVRTEAFDPALVEDPSLIFYHPVRAVDGGLIVSNGDQTDTIRDFLARGLSMEQALRTRRFEPDGPNWTPRISGFLAPDGSYKLSILKAADGQGKGCLRQTFEYPGEPGCGHLIHTYVRNGEPLPSFSGEPAKVSLPGSLEELTDRLWASLDGENKISLFVRFTKLSDGKFTQRILNKNQ